LEPRAGFEPATCSLQGLGNGQQLTIDWQKFEEWVREKHYRGNWSNTILTSAKKYGRCLLEANLAEIAALPDSARPNVLKALAALSKFQGINEQ